MRFRRLISAFVLLAVFTMAVRVSVDTDTWWHLRAGAWMVEHQQLLRTDPFSLTRQGQPWIYPGWLAQLILYGVYAAVGYAGLNLLTALMVAVAFGVIWSVLEGPLLLRAAITLLAATASGVYWSARPQIFTLVLAAAFLVILQSGLTGGLRRLALLPLLMALWVNLHGGFIVGFLILGAYLGGELIELVIHALQREGSLRDLIGRQRDRLIALGAVTMGCVVALGLNPHGFRMLAYPLQTVSIGVLQDYIQEWQSPNFHRLEVQPFLWMLLLLLVAFAASPRRPRPVELVLVSGFAYMALLAGRNVALFALVGAVPLARHGNLALQPLLAGRSRGRELPLAWRRRINTTLFLLFALAALVKILPPLSQSVNEAAIREQVPVGAVDYIRARRPPGPLFNSYNWGGYVLWALYPEYLSFVDGRTDLFDDQILTEYLDAWRATQGWQETFARWGIRTVLLERDAPLVEPLQQSGWVVLYEDSQAVVLSIGEGL